MRRLTHLWASSSPWASLAESGAWSGWPSLLPRATGGRLVSARDTPAWDGGCRTKPSAKAGSTLVEAHVRAAEHADVARGGPRVTRGPRLFGTHPYNGSREAAGGLCDSLRAKRHSLVGKPQSSVRRKQ